MYMVQGVLCVLLCWVCCLIKSDQLGELPSPSARRLCKTCIFKNESYCKKQGLRKAYKENSCEKGFAKYVFLLFGAC